MSISVEYNIIDANNVLEIHKYLIKNKTTTTTKKTGNDFK